MAGKWPPAPDYDINDKFSVTETTYGAMNHGVTMLLERRRAQIKSFRDPTIKHIPPPPPPNICVRDRPDPDEYARLEPPPIHKDLECAARYDRYQHDMERYDRFQEQYPKPKIKKASEVAAENVARIGRWGANWSNLTETTNAVGGYDVYINGNARLKAQEAERQRKMEMQECFARRRMPPYATNRTSKLAIARMGRDPFDTYCSTLPPPQSQYNLDFRNVDCSYLQTPPPDYKYKGFYQYRPFRSSVSIPAYNRAMEPYFILSRHPARVPQPVTTV